MEKARSVQHLIFEDIKEKLSANISFVNEIAEVLDLSHDSAYRRIRGDKPITIEDLLKLKTHFGISVDAFCGEQKNHVTFETALIEPEKFRVVNWLDKILADLTKINLARDKQIIYAAKDPPLFHYFQLPEIAVFKMFFWEKTLFRFPEYEEKKFDLEDFNDEIYKKGRNILALTTKIPTVEIWNENTFRIFISQIEYYWVSGFFIKKDHLKNLLDKMEKLIRHIQKEAELGFKFLYGTRPEGVENNFRLYLNEVVYNDNTIMIKTNIGQAAYLTFNVLSLLKTTNQIFCTDLYKYFLGLMEKSTLISHTSAKERNRYFNHLLKEISVFRKNV